ncbi:hypothetical protein K438DRAFT_2103266 [Mycena galopus ATCC 62051]|nr:hypothetical protein K438DRAFT_2103266 [Mycena galopus ATCC 62051]
MACGAIRPAKFGYTKKAIRWLQWLLRKLSIQQFRGHQVHKHIAAREGISSKQGGSLLDENAAQLEWSKHPLELLTVGSGGNEPRDHGSFGRHFNEPHPRTMTETRTERRARSTSARANVSQLGRPSKNKRQLPLNPLPFGLAHGIYSEKMDASVELSTTRLEHAEEKALSATLEAPSCPSTRNCVSEKASLCGRNSTQGGKGATSPEAKLHSQRNSPERNGSKTAKGNRKKLKQNKE